MTHPMRPSYRFSSLSSLYKLKKIAQRFPVEAVPGAMLLMAALLAMGVVNSPWASFYQSTLDLTFSIGPTGGGITMSVASWVKNALMAVFFFYVSLELKRELLEGQLSSAKAASLPVLAAAGGMAVPALVYWAFTETAGFARGWAIPAATDIAFALGVLSLLGKRVPAALKAFLLAVAVVDDLGAIVIVAMFYTERVVSDYLALSAGVCAVLWVMNRLNIASIGLYWLAGAVLWVVMYQSGISPTIAGVLVAACVPLKIPQSESQQVKIKHNTHSPLHDAEHSFRPWVLFGIMPVFAFANAGVSLAGASEFLTHPITLGAALGLIIGKPIGIVAMSYLGALMMKSRPPGTGSQLLGVGCIAGIGFTMSLFIGALAFNDPALATPVRLGVYGGSVISAVLGLAILSFCLPRRGSSVGANSVDETRPFIAAAGVSTHRNDPSQ